MGTSIRPVIKEKALNKMGLTNIYLQVIIDRKMKLFNTGLKVSLENWEGHSIKNTHPLALKMNKALSTIKLKAEEAMLQITLDGNHPNFEQFEEIFLDKPVSSNDFYDFASNYIELRKSQYSEGFYHQFKCELTKLQGFAPLLTLSQFTTDMLERYDHFMRAKLRNKPNTVGKTMKRLKQLANAAYQKKLIKKNPFDNYRISWAPTNKEYLSIEEINKLEETLPTMPNEGFRNVLRAFLFCCYSGLRYQDLYDLKWINIIEQDHIRVKMHKTGHDVIIPLIQKAIRLLPERAGDDQNVFTVYTNQKCNQYLKAIMPLAGINKDVSFHVSRHTFATVSLNLGMPIEVVSKLLGHTDIKTTQVYAKLMDKTKFEQMKKWDNL